MRFPLTRVQMAYLMGRSQEFNGQVATHAYYEFKNSLNIPQYEKAVNKVIKRHEALRTVIEEDGTQSVLDTIPYFTIPIVDMTGQSEEEQQEYIKKKRKELSHKIFPIGSWPMFDMEAVQLEKESVYLFFNFDLLIADGSSMKLFLKEVAEEYLHPNINRVEMPVQFREYIAYSDKKKQGRKYKMDKEFWLEQIDDFPLAPELPQRLDVRKEKVTFARLEKKIPITVWKKFREQVQEKGLPTSMVFLTIYVSALANYTRQDRFTINVTLSNRGKMNGRLKDSIGDFTSLMLLPIDMKGLSVDFWERVHQVQAQFIHFYKHASYDGVDFEQEIRKYHQMENQISFPIVFTSMEEMSGEMQIEPVLGEQKFSISQTPQVYLDFQIIQIRDSMNLTWDYATNQYEAELMQKIFSDFTFLLDAVLKEQEEDILQDRIYTDKEQEVFCSYNQTAEKTYQETLQDILQEAWNKNQEQIALVDNWSKMTYAELNRQSDCVAAYLSEHGVQAGEFVAVQAKRKCSTIVSILGIIKAGAAYVAIDPAYPKARQEYILQHCGCKCMLTGEEVVTGKVFKPSENNKAKKDDIAYIIYTSGSTGNPKGVEITHEAVTNTIVDMNRRFEICSTDTILGISSYCFDLSVYDIFGSIFAGATHRIASEARDIAQIKRHLLEDGITVWNSVPAIFQLTLEAFLPGEESHALRRVFLSGDFIPIGLVEKAGEYVPEASVISLGGATEAAIWSIYYPINHISEQWTRIPYGFPLANQQCYVLDAKGRQTNFGVEGEICIGGVGLAKGYHLEKKLTKQAFFEHPQFGRLYRTGDLGVFQKEGYIDILGRIDQQVKVNGFRIETAEIESAVEQNELVEQAIVSVSASNKQKRLGLYLKPKIRREYRKDNLWEKITQIAILESENVQGDWKKEKMHLQNQETDAFAGLVIYYYIGKLTRNIKKPMKITVEEFITRAEIRPVYQKIVKVWLDWLCRENKIRNENETYVIEEHVFPDLEEVLTRLDVLENKRKRNMEYLRQCILHIEEILKGKVNAVTYLFPNGALQNAEGIYQKNPISQYFNQIVAQIVTTIEKEKAGSVNILEVGAGTGGTTDPVLEQLNGEKIRYLFTDISDFFTKEAKKRYVDKSFVKYGSYNIDEMPQQQGMQLEKQHIIIAANVLHDSKDIQKTIRYLWDMLEPEGILVIIEMTKDTGMQLISTRLIEGYSNYDDFRKKKNSPLLSGQEWIELLKENHFSAVQLYPDNKKLDIDLGEHVILAKKENTRAYLRKTELTELKQQLIEKLPIYMIPTEIIQLSEIPLNGNGKVERGKLPSISSVQMEHIEIQQPRTEIEKRLYDIWNENLENSEFGVYENFFQIGGDSIIMLKIVSEIKEKFHFSYDFKEFMAHGTIAEIAKYIESKVNA